MYGPCCAVAPNQSTSKVAEVAKMSDAMPALPEVDMPAANSPAKSAVQLVLQVAMVTQRVLTGTRVRQYPSRLPGQCSHSGVWCYAPAMGRLASHMPHRLACNRRHDFQKMPCTRITVKSARHRPDVLGEVRRSLVYGPGNLRKQLLRRGRDRLGHYRQQFAGSHSNERKEVLGGFIFRFCLGRQFSQVLHHGIGIDLADRAEFVLEFILEFALVFELTFVFAFAEEAAKTAEYGAELILLLVLEFVFQFALVFQFIL
jgi:hypothetical protein